MAACAVYAGVAKAVVHALKFERCRAAAVPIAGIMARHPTCREPLTLITSVPTATKRRRARGYDQTDLICSALSQQIGVPYIPLLARLGQSRQVGQGRANRQQQRASTYRPLHSALLANATILLIDDVITTGATLQAAARALQLAGAARVMGLGFAAA